MTRRIGAPGAPFGGAVIVSMDPQYFLRLYDDINVGRHGAIALIGTDAVVRVRRLGREEEVPSPTFTLVQVYEDKAGEIETTRRQLAALEAMEATS